MGVGQQTAIRIEKGLATMLRKEQRGQDTLFEVPEGFYRSYPD
jgi:hypothetical protein